MTNKSAPTKLTDCYYFLTGTCNNKECRFRHCQAAKAVSTDCETWPQCINLTCPGRHPSTKKAPSTSSTLTTASTVPTTVETQRTESVTTLWDLENVAIPRGQSAFNIVMKMKKQLIEDKGMHEADFRAYCGNGKLLKKHRLELEMANVTVIDVADDSKQSVDRRMYMDLQKLTFGLKPPATIVLINSDKDFIQYLGKLRFVDRFTVINIYNAQVNEKLLQTAHVSYPWTDFISDLVDEVSPIITRPSLHNVARQKFKCPLCPLILTSAKMLEDHQTDTKHWYTCNYSKCSVSCFTAEWLRSHVKREHDEAIKRCSIVCDTCGKTFFSEARRAQHEEDTHRRIAPIENSASILTADLIKFDDKNESDVTESETQSDIADSEPEFQETKKEFLIDLSDFSLEKSAIKSNVY